jgi:hypothetical protein
MKTPPKTAVTASAKTPLKSKVCRALGTLAAAGTIAALGSVAPALAGGPLPYDLITPPPNVNIAIIYNEVTTGNSFYTAGGTKVGDTSVVTDVPILRFVHTFGQIFGAQWGVQIIAPDVNFIGSTKIGGADLSNNGGFAEPQLSAFIYPYSNPTQDAYFNVTYFFSPAVGAYNANAALNASSNTIVNNLEVGFGHRLFGEPKGKRLDLEVWLDGYVYGNNSDGPLIGPFKTTVHTQAAGQVIVYLPYYFHPQTAGYVGLSFEQTVGGKAYLTSPIGNFDTGNRNNVTTIGVNAGTFLAPTIATQISLTTDVRTRGGLKNNVIFLAQVAKIF